MRFFTCFYEKNSDKLTADELKTVKEKTWKTI